MNLEIVTETIEKLEAEVDARLKRIQNLKLIKRRIIAELNGKGK